MTTNQRIMKTTMNILRAFILLAAAIALQAQQVTISDVLTTTPGGGAWTGTIVVRLNSPSYAYYGTTSLSGWQYVLCVGGNWGECSAQTAAGVITIPLYATTTMTPSGLSYSATYAPRKGSRPPETWTVSPSHTKLYEIRSSPVPTPTVTFSPTQIAPGSNGQVLTTVSGAAAWSNGTTASSAIDFASIPDGACLSNTFTLTGAALGDHLALGVSGTALPDGILATVRVSASNTAQVQVCNLSGAAVDLSSRTYSARIVR